MSVADVEVTIFDTRLKEERDYWINHLSFEGELSNVMLDHERPSEYSPVKQTVEVSFSAADSQKLIALTNGSLVLLNATLVAAVNIVLHRYTSSRKIVVGSPTVKDENRQKANVVAIVNEVDGQMSFRQLLLKVRERLMEAYARSRYPFSRLVNDLKLQNGNRCPLFDCVLMVRGLHAAPPELSNDITMIFANDRDQVTGSIQFNPQLFETGSIEKFSRHLANTLHQALQNIETHVSEFSLLTEVERHEILVDWNNTETLYQQPYCVHQLFEEQVARTPNAIAVKFQEERLTYRELNERANQLAHYLRRLGVGPETRVGIYLERSVSMVVTLFGILKAGAAYVPFDTTYPEMRLRFMLEDARIPVLVTQPDLAGKLPDGTAKIIKPDVEWDLISQESQANPALEISADNLCYVIYTSGSTGRPKGVMISHRGLTNYLKWSTNAYRVSKGGGAPVHSAIGADLTITGLFAPLLVGRSITLVPEGYGVQALSEVLQSEKNFSLTKITPAHLEVLGQLIDSEQAAGQTRVLIVGGEALRGEQLSFWQTHAPSTRLINEYGPTETVVGCCVYEVPLGTPISGPVPIGRPITNTQLYVLDQYLQPVPVGVTGELYIGGASVARGYLDRPELTAERFVPNMFGRKPGTRLYKTGDLVRYLPDGNIEFLNRNDQQVKIRGHRIELREVETRVNQHPQINECVVLARESKSGERRLVAFMTTKADAPSVSDLRGFVAETLPEHMIPSTYVFLDAFPLTPNGKVDHQALTVPESHGSGSAGALSMPGTPTEEVLIGIWSGILGVNQIGVHDNFLELGGHSLLATQVVSRIREAFQIEISLRDFFESPTVAELARKVDAVMKAGNGSLISHIEPTPRTENLPLSFAQRRLWFLDQLEPGGFAFNITRALRLSGKLNTSALERSVSELVRRHEVLRTTFVTVNGEAVQVIAPPQQVRLSILDFSEMELAERQREIERQAAEEAHRSFALNQDSPWRVQLLRLDEEEHVLLFTLHHIVSDAWSMEILVREVSALYEAYAAGRKSPLTDLPIQYADYAVWQRGWLQGEVLEEQLGYWRKQLTGAPAVLELPTDRVRPAQQSHRGAQLPLQLPAELSAGLKQLSQREGVTLFMTLLAGWQLLLARYSRQPDVVVGSPVANRTRAEVEGLIGFFVNTLVLRTEVDGELRVRELLQRVREVCLGAYAHQEVPFEMLVEQLQPERDLSYTPLFQVMMMLQNTPPQQRTEWAGVGMSAVEVESGTAKYDMTLGLAESPQGLVGTLEYNRDLYERESMERLLGHYQQVLTALVAQEEQRVWEVRLLSAAEEAQVLRQASGPRAEYESEASLAELFERQAERTPEQIAVIHEEKQFTYRELNARANQLAHYLRSRGVKPESLVALVMERSVEMVVGVLGVMKAGGAYLPVDPTYPLERVRFMLEDAGARLVLTAGAVAPSDEAGSSHVMRVDEQWPEIATQPETNPQSVTVADNLAYVIYTSGSTGRPKGVFVSNQNLIHSTSARFTYYERPIETFLLLSSFAFDSSVAGIFWTLCQGGALLLPPKGIERDPSELRNLISRHQVTDMLCLPSLYALLLDQAQPEQLASLRTVIVAGEACPEELITNHYEQLDQAVLFNEYGPTEGTVWSTVARFKPQTSQVTIGSAISNVCVYVLDDHLNLVPIGIGGEIYIGGEGLTRGYLNQPELTAQRFVPNVFNSQPGARLYKTGDLARYLPHGDLVLLGRNDHQVKLRGYRIELNEIEAVMLQHPDVREVVVVCREDSPNDKRLVAYLVAEKESAPSTSDLRQYLQAELPAYMVPSVFMTLNELPLAPNGKVNRHALPVPEGARPELNILYAAPETVIEKRLAGIWGSVLNVERIGRDDNFFDLGGHSFLVVKVHERIRQEMQVEIPLIKLFEFPTIFGLSQFLENQQEASISVDDSQAWASRRRQALQRQRQALRN